MVPVLGRVASGMRQGAWVERHQDLDSPRTRRRSVRQSVWQSNTEPCSARHHWFARWAHSVVSTECARRSTVHGQCDAGSQEHRGRLRRADRARTEPFVPCLCCYTNRMSLV